METAVQNTTKQYENYKPSGVEWLGDIPEHWEVSRLGVLLNPISINNRTDLSLLSITREKGVILRDLEDEGTNHNFIPDDLSNYKVLLKGQFGMNKMKAWQGSYGISDYDGIVSPAYFIFDLDKKITPEYFHLSIRSKLYVSFFGSASDGVRIGQWDLSKERMKQIPFLIPSLKEQTAIAEFLDDKTTKIDQAIAIKQQQIDLLKERHQILIHKAVTKGINPNVKLKDSGVEWIGEIPEGWEVKRLKFNLKKSFSGGTPSTDKLIYWDGGIPWVSSVDVKVDYLNKTVREISLMGLQNSSSNLAPKGALIFVTRSGILQHTFAISILNREMAINQDIKCIIFNDKIQSEYFLNLIKGNNSEILVEVRQQAATVESINMSSFYNLLMPVPPIEEQKEISAYIENITDKIATAIAIKKQEIEKLKEYKSSLIDGVVTGKVRVF
ncbi:type I restriction enzyme, S subunit [Flavobacterium gillisiae]|uniref:Type I restriction enzyme, S subunit n=1 Tax=Flavobacterium gillisiae TaxID=150146 RepID=A0A1H4G9T4_9FLAO|nr:restriction endonuclease subunit S [Flavobacterium gillisiae]SEB06386.1 type I restriction enzyme, S subunit [Flavobacterium gillisiae]